MCIRDSLKRSMLKCPDRHGYRSSVLFEGYESTTNEVLFIFRRVDGRRRYIYIYLYTYIYLVLSYMSRIRFPAGPLESSLWEVSLLRQFSFRKLDIIKRAEACNPYMTFEGHDERWGIGYNICKTSISGGCSRRINLLSRCRQIVCDAHNTQISTNLFFLQTQKSCI